MGMSQFPDAPAIVKDSLAKKHPQLLARADKSCTGSIPDCAPNFARPWSRTARITLSCHLVGELVLSLSARLLGWSLASFSSKDTTAGWWQFPYTGLVVTQIAEGRGPLLGLD